MYCAALQKRLAVYERKQAESGGFFRIIPDSQVKRGKFDIYLQHLLTSAGGGDIIQMYKIKAVTETVLFLRGI